MGLIGAGGKRVWVGLVCVDWGSGYKAIALHVKGVRFLESDRPFLVN